MGSQPDRSLVSPDVVVAVGWLAAAAALVILFFWLVRRWLLRCDDDRGEEIGFTLSDLRRLHQEGELTDEQYESAKAALIAQGLAAMGGMDDRPTDQKPATPGESDSSGLSDESITPDSDNSSDKNPGEDGAGRGS